MTVGACWGRGACWPTKTGGVLKNKFRGCGSTEHERSGMEVDGYEDVMPSREQAVRRGGSENAVSTGKRQWE